MTRNVDDFWLYIYISHIDFENTNIVQWHGYVMLWKNCVKIQHSFKYKAAISCLINNDD